MSTYTVVKGDTLSELAVKFGTTVSNLVKWNNIEDPDFIVIGQKLVTSASESKPSSQTVSSKATIKAFGLQSNTDRTVYASWTWNQSNTENYEVMWYYDTGDGIWFVGNDSTEKYKQSTYSAPSNAKRVKFKVKPVSKKRTVNNKETSYWTAGWSTEEIYSFSDNPPVAPNNAPTVEIEKYTLTARYDNLTDLNATGIQFQIVKDDKSVFKTGKADILTTSAIFSCMVNAGSKYKVRARSYKGDVYSKWTDYSNNEPTIPAKPSSITTCKANSATSVYLEWGSVASAETYDIQYTTKKEYFDGSDQVTTKNGIEFPHYEITNLDIGKEYFFRVRAVNEKGESDWTAVKSVVIGKKPSAPTTWSSTTTVMTGEPLNLYWVHNAEDESSQTYAELERIIDGITYVDVITNTASEEDKDKTSVFPINTSEYREGTKILWKVRTAGITGELGEWSVQRTVDVYAPVTLELNLITAAGESIDTLTGFPCYVSALAGPNTQAPIGYHVAVTANETYETVDHVGNIKMVSVNEAVYSKHFDTKDELMLELSAGNIDLENNIRYTIHVTVSMNTGLKAEETIEFVVAWDDLELDEPNAEIGIDEETYSAYIRPYCIDYYGNYVENLTLSVYRREFDGSFVELITGVPNTGETFITDPHPSLDLARYRIVATDVTTGAVRYCDLPGYPVGGKAIIIQWDEEWSQFDTTNEDEMEKSPWSGSLLKLPYNIDISEKNDPDVSLVEYIGRSQPVSYYGTQIGTASSWSAEIPAYDKETIYTLRRLSAWMGDVYVREPSGLGYWANVTVSFSQKHCEVTIPVSLDITRVAGGI